MFDPEIRFHVVSLDHAERRRDAERQRLVSRSPHPSRWQRARFSVRVGVATYRHGFHVPDAAV